MEWASETLANKNIERPGRLACWLLNLQPKLSPKRKKGGGEGERSGTAGRTSSENFPGWNRLPGEGCPGEVLFPCEEPAPLPSHPFELLFWIVLSGMEADSLLAAMPAFLRDEGKNAATILKYR